MEENFSQMIDDNVDCLEAIGKKYLLTNGANVKSDIAEYERRKKAVDKDIRRIVGDREYEEYKRDTAHSDSVRDENFYRLAVSKMRTNTIKSMEDDELRAASIAIDDDVLESASVLSNDLSNGEITGKSMENKLDFLDTMQEHCNTEIDGSESLTDEQKKVEKGKVSAAVIAQKSLYSADAVSKMQTVYSNRTVIAEEQAKRLVDRIQGQFNDSFGFWAKCNSDGDTAFANSAASCKKFAKHYFSERIARGQEHEVLAQLEYLQKSADDAFKESKKVKRVDAEGKPVLDKDGNEQFDYTGDGKYEPFRTLYCSRADFSEIRDMANSAIEKRARQRKLKDAERIEALKMMDADIRIEADKLSTQPILNMDEMNALIQRTDNLLRCGYVDAYKTSQHLTSIIKAAERKYESAQKDSQKLETVEDFQREYNEYMENVQRSAPFMFFIKNGSYQTEDGSIDVSKDVDGQNRMILLIRNGQSRGILKGPVWESRLKKLTEDRASEDYDAAMIAISNAGITVDEKASQSLREAFGTRSADVADELGASALKSIWSKDESGRLKLSNAKYMMYTWNDPKTGKCVPISGDELNQLLKVVSAWQRRHVNPSPSGQPSEDLNDFIIGTLKDSVRRKTIKHFIGPNEIDAPFAFSDIELAGRKRIQTYFAGDRKKGKEYNMSEFYDRDLSILENAAVNGPLPTKSQVIQALRNRIEK